MARRAASTMSLLIATAFIATLAGCADLSASIDAAHAPDRSAYPSRGNAMNPLGEQSTVNPLAPSPG